MFRRSAVAVALLSAAALAAPVPKAPPPPAPKSGTTVTLATAKVNGELIQLTQTVNVTRYVAVQEVIKQDGQEVTVTRTVPQTQQVQQVVHLALKGTKATTADGKEVSEEDLAKKLGDGAAVVSVPPGFDPEWRKLFADDVLFLEPSNVRGGFRPGLGGGPAILPAVPPPAIAPLPLVPPPLPPPPVEKK